MVIVDFGLAVYMPTNGTKLKLGCGSLGYVAPEMLTKEGYDMNADMFSLGSILYVMLCGKQCFRSRDQKELERKNKKGDVVFNSDLWGTVPVLAKNFVQMLLQKD